MAAPSAQADIASSALVGDFGGTNVRLALADLSVEPPAIGTVRHFRSKDFPKAADTVAAYLADLPSRPRVVVVAAAGPVKEGGVKFTNLGWTLSESEFQQMGFAQAKIVNDFVAMAFATRLLGESDVHPLGKATPEGTRNVAVMGPGTGFGAAALVVSKDGRSLALAGEAGHASFAPADEVEIEILRYLSRQLGHVSVERILSGPGLLHLHEALNAIEATQDDVADSEDLTRRALEGEGPSLRTLLRFCAILGSVAGDLALTYGAEGGVYIAGGIAPNILGILERSTFRNRFESKGRFVDYLRPIATRVVVRPDAAFLGAAQVARDIRNR